jgi:hypothetical protein
MSVPAGLMAGGAWPPGSSCSRSIRPRATASTAGWPDRAQAIVSASATLRSAGSVTSRYPAPAAAAHDRWSTSWAFGGDT